MEGYEKKKTTYQIEIKRKHRIGMHTMEIKIMYVIPNMPRKFMARKIKQNRNV